MASTRDLLQRFRPAGAPGPATATGVPADRIEERAAELEPVFRLLEDAAATAESIRQQAQAEAGERRTRSRDLAVARVAEARLAADAIRADALAEAQRSAAVAAQLSADHARAVAEDIGNRSRRSIDADVAAVVARVRTALAAASEGSPS